MAEKSDNKDQLKERLKKRYRVIFLNDDTLNEIKSFKLKIWHIIAGIGASFLLVSLLTFLFIFLTPVNKWISSWIGIENNAIFIDLNKKIFELEQLVESQEVYKSGIENLINGVRPPDATMQASVPSGEVQTSKINAQHTSIDDFFLTSPVKGSVSDTFDISRGHYGVDIVAPKDTPIKSIMPGVVISADWNPETGNSISVQHPFGVVSIYKHNSSLLKKIGDQVEEGEAIAVIGNTGELSTGPHLHFEVWYEGEAINPQKLLKY